ncbi:endonuclease/exonuclease/phosphatase family protein [Trifolium medium]|uniref:Endonuclease/exonuclease/phosphatase family protein n=1 Tax=Trifolium medium TaxID=97028 RepID=A0A392MJ06_9FABA|nr:endonuclease/exonuclease/phosphatase family protein [Trifolium medium]
MVRQHKIDFLAIQETKLEVISESLCHSLWGSNDCQWVFLPSEGRSGGILSIWSKSHNSLIFSFMGEGFVGVCLERGRLKTICFVGEERSGVNSGVVGTTTTETFEFRNFIEELELVDLPLIGRHFTWYQSSGRAMSRIDRMLISDEWAIWRGNGSLWALPRDVSDHCPLLLRYLQEDWGPKPFRFNNFWLENKKFVKLVEAFLGKPKSGRVDGFCLEGKVERAKNHS